MKEILNSAPLVVKVGEHALLATPKQFSTGSVGFHGQGKVHLVVDGKPVVLQANLLLTVVGSKPKK